MNLDTNYTIYIQNSGYKYQFKYYSIIFRLKMGDVIQKNVLKGVLLDYIYL